jgi:hypothetical protein
LCLGTYAFSKCPAGGELSLFRHSENRRVHRVFKLPNFGHVRSQGGYPLFWAKSWSRTGARNMQSIHFSHKNVFCIISFENVLKTLVGLGRPPPPRKKITLYTQNKIPLIGWSRNFFSCQTFFGEMFFRTRHENTHGAFF